jgi:hypothetical protein
MRKAITIKYIESADGTMLYGPGVELDVQKSNVKAAVQAIVSGSGSGALTRFEIWEDSFIIQKYYAKYPHPTS